MSGNICFMAKGKLIFFFKSGPNCKVTSWQIFKLFLTAFSNVKLFPTHFLSFSKVNLLAFVWRTWQTGHPFSLIGCVSLRTPSLIRRNQPTKNIKRLKSGSDISNPSRGLSDIKISDQMDEMVGKRNSQQTYF